MSRKRRWLVVLHALLAAYVLPAFFLAGQPPAPGSLVGSWRAAIGLQVRFVGLLLSTSRRW